MPKFGGILTTEKSKICLGWQIAPPKAQCVPSCLRSAARRLSARRRRPEDLAAYGLTMRAFPFVFASNPAAATQALEFLNRAIEMEPDYAPSTALAAWCHAQLVLYNGTPSPVQERKNALLLSERAGILDPDDPLVLTARCAVHTMAGQLDHARALISRALELDPTLVWSWDRSGWLNAYAGNAKTAIKHFEQATRRD